MKRKERGGGEINSSSMADIAFLLLIFFLVTTTIPNEKGLMIQLPQKLPPDQPPAKLADRNVFKVLINSSDNLLVEDELLDDPLKLKEMAKEHILNPSGSDKMPESPSKAVVSLKNDRGTSYEMFITVLDQLQGAYYEIWGESVGLTSEQYRNLDRTNPEDLELYELAKTRSGLQGMSISIAQPTK